MKLKVYDFDDTLAVSKGVIRLHRESGWKKVYNSEEFVSYTPLSGDLLCFSDLNHLTQVRLILNNWEEMVSDLSDHQTDVMIVTSRPPGAASAITKLLEYHGLLFPHVLSSPVSRVHALGSGNPKDKVLTIDRALQIRKYEYVRFVDDNPKMVEAVKSYFGDKLECEWDADHHSHDNITEQNLSPVLGDFLSDNYEVWQQKVR